MKGTRPNTRKERADTPEIPSEWPQPARERRWEDRGDLGGPTLGQPGPSRSAIQDPGELEPVPEDFTEELEERREGGARRNIGRPKKSLQRQVCQSNEPETLGPELPTEEPPVRTRETSRGHDRVFEEAPAPPTEVTRPPGAGGAQPGSSAKKETAEPGPVSGRPRRLTRTPKYLEDFEVYEMNIDNGTPVRAEKTAEATASLPVLKKSYRDALIGVKALSVAKQNTEPTIQSRRRKKCWPTGPINETDEPGKFWQFKKPGPCKDSRQLRKSGQSDEARTPIGSQQMSRP